MKPPHHNRTLTVKQLILGSTSPFRRKLLEAAGLVFATAAPAVDEATITAADAKALAQSRADAKALAVAALQPTALVIGADQVLGLDGRSFDKVTTPEAARNRLRLLAGRTHHLHAALSLAMGSELLHRQVVSVAMPMRDLSESELDAYIASGEWQGSVGCYQYEHRGVHLFVGVQGDQSAIVGLPMQELLAALRQLGIDTLVQAKPPWQLSLAPLSLS